MIGKDGFIMLLYGLIKYMEFRNRKAMKKKILMILNRMMTQMTMMETMKIKKNGLNQVKILLFLVSILN